MSSWNSASLTDLIVLRICVPRKGCDSSTSGRRVRLSDPSSNGIGVNGVSMVLWCSLKLVGGDRSSGPDGGRIDFAAP